MNFQRARNKQAKAERWDEIVNSTLSLFEKTSYANITIKDIAQKTSFTRGNIYKYISTKNEILSIEYAQEMASAVVELSGVNVAGQSKKSFTNY